MELALITPVLVVLAATGPLERCPDLSDAGEGEACGGVSGIVCEAHLSCHTTDPDPDAEGVCRDYSIEQGDACISDATCERGTLCSNFNVSDPIVGRTHDVFALCEPAWMLGSFQSRAAITIPPGASGDSPIRVHGLATVGMNAIIDIELELGAGGGDGLATNGAMDTASATTTAEHPAACEHAAAQLQDELQDELAFRVVPGATGYDTPFGLAMVDPSKLQRRGCVLQISDLPVAAPGDDSVNVAWVLRISNSAEASATVLLRRWQLRVSSRWD